MRNCARVSSSDCSNALSVCCDRQLLAVRGERQPGAGDFTDQRDAGGALCLAAGEILLLRRLAEVAQPAEQIDLERGDAAGTLKLCTSCTPPAPAAPPALAANCAVLV
jgi:hypothetical protein